MAKRDTPIHPKKISFGSFELDDIAAHMVGQYQEYTEDKITDDEIEDLLMSEFGIGFTELDSILAVLLPMAGTFQSPLTNNWYRAFSIVEKDGQALALLKMEIDPKDQCNVIPKAKKTE